MVLIISMECDKMYTTIQIKRTTKIDLTKLGNKGDTYDDIIKKLLTEVQNK